MATVFDVAAYILKNHGPMTAMKLQKLVYYSQAWSLVWDERPLFRAQIQAWANGPVVPALYEHHRGKFRVSRSDFPNANPNSLTRDEKETVQAVLSHYGNKTSQQLSDLTHSERPWKEARGGLSPGVRGRTPITRSAIAEYYESL